MMSSTIFCDPRCYIFDEQDWDSSQTQATFKDLVEFLAAVQSDDMKHCKNRNLPVNFHCSDELHGLIYAHNPYLNSPPNEFYRRQYQLNVLPALTRMIDICTQSNDDAQPPRVLPARVGSTVDETFAEFINKCDDFDQDNETIYLNSPNARSISYVDLFTVAINLSEKASIGLISPSFMLKRAIELSDQRLLNLSIESFGFRKGREDISWRGASRTQVVPSARFWRSIQQADFRENESAYLTRIVSVLSQLSFGVYEDLNQHPMQTQTFQYNGREINRWNAYVYRSAHFANDRRCSRIYYGSIPGAWVLDNFDPDAH